MMMALFSECYESEAKDTSISRDPHGAWRDQRDEIADSQLLTTLTMASGTTASQTELKAHKVPLAWRDQCSACVPGSRALSEKLILSPTISIHLCTINVSRPTQTIAFSFHLTSVESKHITCLGNVIMNAIHMKSVSYPPVNFLFTTHHFSSVKDVNMMSASLFISRLLVYIDLVNLPKSVMQLRS